MRCTYKLKANRIFLTALKEDDIEPLRKLRNRPDIRQWFNYKEKITQEEQQKWFQSYLADPSDIIFAIFANEQPNQLIGIVSLYNIQNGEAEFGRIVIDSKNTPHRGLGFEATQAVLEFGFNQLHLLEIRLEVFSSNQRALALYKKIGFQIVKQDNEKIYMKINKE